MLLLSKTLAIVSPTASSAIMNVFRATVKTPSLSMEAVTARKQTVLMLVFWPPPRLQPTSALSSFITKTLLRITDTRIANTARLMRQNMKNSKTATHVWRAMHSQDGDHVVLALLFAYSFHLALISFHPPELERYSTSLNNVLLSSNQSAMIFLPTSQTKLFFMAVLFQLVSHSQLLRRRNHLTLSRSPPSTSRTLHKFQSTATALSRLR